MIKEGTVLLYHSTGLLPLLIRKFTKSNWNHAGIVTDKTDYGYLVYEAQAEGFVKSEYTFEYLQRRLDARTIKAKNFKAPLKNVKKECDKLLGTKYGFTTLLKIAWAIIFNKKERDWSDGEKRVICSEAVSRILYKCSNKVIDLPTEFGKTHDYISPDDIDKSTQ